MEKKNLDRRQFLRRSLSAVGMTATVAAGVTSGVVANAATCLRTRPQGEGPYYPESDLNRDTDLTRLDPMGVDAEGEVIDLSGLVQDAACNPVKGALIEIWQANTHGKYDHSGDANPLPVDRNFQHWGRMTTGTDGKYAFHTIMPGYYPLDPSLVGATPSGPRQFRPPHIHVKISARGFQSLTTQIYFHPDSYSDTTTKDLVKDLNKWENVASDLMVTYLLDPKDAAKPRAGEFSFTLTKR